jgi:hypothetical protein
VGNKTLYVERLKFVQGRYNYLLGFGLKSAAAHLRYESGFTLTGHPIPPSTGNNWITPELFVTGLSHLGITAGALPSPLPVISGLILRTYYTNQGFGNKNLVDYPVLLAFLGAYMTSSAEKAKLDGLTVDRNEGSFYLRKTLPYSGNTIAVNEADKVNGNLAVWLSSQVVVDLQEVYLTNPTLYTSTTSIGLRNVVLEGDNWKHIEAVASTGVVVSVNTPVKGIVGTNLWYVVQDCTDTGDDFIEAIVDVLEVHDAAAATRLIAPNITLHIDGLIVPNSTIRNTLISKFPPRNEANVYINTRPPNATWADYAASVAAGTTPVFP